MRHKNGIPGAKPRLVFQKSVDEIPTILGGGKMTIREFVSNMIGAALFVVAIWLYTIMFTLLFAAE